MAKNIPNLAEDTNTQIYPSMIILKESTLNRFPNFWKLKTEKTKKTNPEIFRVASKRWHLSYKKNNLNDWISHQKPWRWGQVAPQSRHSKMKRLCCQQNYSRRMANESFLNRKETIKRMDILEHQKRKNMISKNKGKCNSHSLSSAFLFYDWRKIINTV